jgi:hypothetical protein
MNILSSVTFRKTNEKIVRDFSNLTFLFSFIAVKCLDQRRHTWDKTENVTSVVKMYGKIKSCFFKERKKKKRVH